jgi:hypothetical protein
MATRSQEQLISRSLSEKLASGNEVMVKEAANTIERYIRTKFKERSFFDKIIEPRQLTSDDFYPHPTRTDKLWYMYEIEPQCPAVLEMAYNTPAPQMTFNARRTLVSIDRIQSVRLQKEVNELIQWSVSLRDIQADFQLKQVEEQFDARGIAAVNVAVGTVPNTVMAATGSVHYHLVDDGLTQNALAESLKYIPDLGEQNGLNSKVLLMNMVTFKEFAKWATWEATEPIAAGILRNGLSEVEDGLLGLKFIITIKKKMVPTGTVYHFADPTYIGANLVWKEPTMIIKQHDFSVEFGVFTERGGAILVYLGLAKVHYTGVRS